MSDVVQMPAMGEAQKQSWHALMELYEQLNSGWTLIGGQLMHLHCAERGAVPSRPTNDVDAVVDVRMSQSALAAFTGALEAMGFTPETSGSGMQHRWRRDEAQVDVLIPEGIGERAAALIGVGGAPTVSAPGTTQALHRSEPVKILAEGRTGTILRPNLVGALVAKAAAGTEIGSGRSGSRHLADFVVLAGLVSARDFRMVCLGRKDRRRLSRMLDRCRADGTAMSTDRAEEALDRLQRAAELSS